MRSLVRLFLAGVLMLSGPAAARCADGETAALSRYFSPESVLDFAEALEQEGDYLRAAGELERYLSLAGAGADAPEVRYRIAGLLRSGGEAEGAVGLYLKIPERWPTSAAAPQALLEAAATLVAAGEPDRALAVLDGAAPLPGGVETASPRMGHVRAVALMQLRRWPAAREALPSGNDATTEELRGLVDRALSAPRRSPAVAGLLSALLPGTGKMYAGQALDGLYSLVSISLLATLSAVSFSQQGVTSAKGWIYASLGAVFYLGNIYGSAAAARQHNERLEQTLLHDAREAAGTLLPVR